ncbi:DUF4229 domain-containing protein [Ornithinimicrobium sp. Arc0846-15]|nr:DUF4229 domain-containing protein [Ornithinimicrobium laminariae]
MSMIVRYSAMRLLIFAVSFLLFIWILGPTIWALVWGALVSMVLSFFLLQHQRNAVAEQVDTAVQSRMERRRAQAAEQRSDEDDEDDESGYV